MEVGAMYKMIEYKIIVKCIALRSGGVFEGVIIDPGSTSWKKGQKGRAFSISMFVKIENSKIHKELWV